ECSLFGRGGAAGSYGFVLGQIPILRPFSRNVQLSNLQERLNLFQEDAPAILALIAVAIALIVAYKIWQWRMTRTGKHLRIASHSAQRLMLWSTAACTASWLLLQGSRPYYLFHIAPLLVVTGAIVLQ